MDWTPASYELKRNGTITKDGHTMHNEDIVRDLNRRSYLERENFILDKKIDSITEELDEYLELKGEKK